MLRLIATIDSALPGVLVPGYGYLLHLSMERLFGIIPPPVYFFSQIMVAGGSPGVPPTWVNVFPSSEAVNANEEMVLPFKFWIIFML